MLKPANTNVRMELPKGLSVVSGTPQKARVPRKPKHTFYIKQYPYELTPFFIAPVLAGETLKNLLLQARTVSTPLEDRLIGGHLEHYFFYVKLRDLADEADIVNMMLDGGTSVDAAGSDNAYFYVKSGAANWFKLATDKVVQYWFRDEDDTASHVGSVTGLPMVMWENKNSVMESLILTGDIPADTIDFTEANQDFEKEYATWEFLRGTHMTELTFEDYLASFGVQLAAAEEGKPELVRMVKNWTYPTNTVDGSGSINTQFSWSVSERADKDRFFKEPGFLVGYTVFRPKVYVSNRKQAAVSIMDTALSWLPATMKDQAHSSLVKFLGNASNAPFTSASTPTGGELDSEDSYWLDVRDIFVFGDQFTNVTLAGDNGNGCRAEDLRDFHGKKYPQSAALQLLGVGDTLTCESDGVVSLNILGTQVDMT